MNAQEQPVAPLRLPAAHDLISFRPVQVPAPGAVYLARFAGDLEALFGPVRELRDREFLLDLGDEKWIATPTPGIFLSTSPDHVMAFDTGGIHARTNGEMSTIDFELLRRV